MGRRNLLRSQLVSAWQQTITETYQNQLINSERGLQVFFCSALLQAFDDAGVKRKIFVEPRLSTVDGGDRRYPDMVVCNSRSVIGIVELKYLPRTRPKYRKDLQTLERASQVHADLEIYSNRFLGKRRNKLTYPLAADSVLCWAGIYTGSRPDLRSTLSKSARSRFLQLDAITSENANPEIVAG